MVFVFFMLAIIVNTGKAQPWMNKFADSSRPGFFEVQKAFNTYWNAKGIDMSNKDEMDDDDFADEMSTEWNLRKCAAAALDVLAVRFSTDLLNVMLEPLKNKLWNTDWLQRESAILALGAIAEGMRQS